MHLPIDHDNEQMAALAFTRQSVIFDKLYASDCIIQYKRKRVRDHVLHWLAPGGSILELNAGTGDDAVYFAQQGHPVHATDISAGMQEKLVEKITSRRLATWVSHERCSYTALETLENRGPYDCIFSNFAGLNCTGELQKVLHSFDSLLKPAGIAVLVILPKFCLWEALLMLKGKFRTATRRFFSSQGRKANIDGASFKCWYYSPGFIVRHLKEKFDLLGVEGLCTIVPPSYMENFAEKYPAAFSFLCKKEDRLKNRWPWKYIGDYYIISLKKKSIL